MNCFFHQNYEAALNCPKCSLPICRDCAKRYGVPIGEWADMPICFRCTKSVAETGLNDLDKSRKKAIAFLVLLSAVAIVSFVIGLADGDPPLSALMTAGIVTAAAGAIWTSFKIFINICLAAAHMDFGGMVVHMFSFIVVPIKVLIKIGESIILLVQVGYTMQIYLDVLEKIYMEEDDEDE